jgi:hypothetical protein
MEARMPVSPAANLSGSPENQTRQDALALAPPLAPVAGGRSDGKVLGMTAAAKRKVTLELPVDLVALVDRHARLDHGSRSGTVEQ